MKKLIGLFVLFFAVNVFAVGAPMSGFYAGAGLGVGHSNYSGTRNFQEFSKSSGGLLASRDLSFKKSDTGMIGTLFVGYGFHIKKNGYLGLELGFDYFPSSANWSKQSRLVNTTPTLTGRTKINSDFNLSVLPGYYFNNQSTLVYGRLGLAYGQFKQTFRNDNQAAAGTSIEDDVQKSVFGATIGLGVDQMISNHLSLRLEGDYTHYMNISKSVNPSVSATGVDPNRTIRFNSNWKIKANSMALKLSLVYTF